MTEADIEEAVADTNAVWAIIKETGVTMADIKKITPTHVHTWNHRKIKHTQLVPETIEFT